MKKRFYSERFDDEECYPLEHFQEDLDSGLHENKDGIDLFIWEMKPRTGTFWCTYHGEGFESGEGYCNKFDCSGYAPRNGKSGICRSYSLPFFPTGNKITIRRSK